MKKLLTCLPVICILLGFLTSAAAAESLAVRVDDVSFTVEEVQMAYAMQLSMLDAAQLTLSEEESAAVMQQVIDSFIIRGLVEKRVQELGLNHMSENERQLLLEQARQSYDSYWQQTRAAVPAHQMTDAQITAYLESNGVTVDWLYRELLYNQHVQALMQHAGYVLEVSDDEVDAFYEDNYVKPFHDRYEGNVPLFEQEVLIPGNETLYLPEGYRVMHHLILPVTPEFTQQLAAIEARAASVQQQMQTLYAGIANRAIMGETVPEDDRNAYLELQDQYDQLTVQHSSVWSAFLLSKQDVLSEIETRLQTGEAFDSVCEDFGGCAADVVFHPDSIYLPEEITASLRTLQAIGDVSQPCLYDDGIHLFCYADDMQSGALPLTTEENKTLVRTMAANTKLDAFLARETEKLRDRYEIMVDTSQLTD